jgi:hypothetical protein
MGDPRRSDYCISATAVGVGVCPTYHGYVSSRLKPKKRNNVCTAACTDFARCDFIVGGLELQRVHSGVRRNRA